LLKKEVTTLENDKKVIFAKDEKEEALVPLKCRKAVSHIDEERKPANNEAIAKTKKKESFSLGCFFLEVAISL
jgi:hypothetical protein